jgi:hypothetical protein
MNGDVIYIGFPNLDYEAISINIVRKWNITEPQTIGDTVFFWVGEVYCQMSEEDFKKL